MKWYKFAYALPGTNTHSTDPGVVQPRSRVPEAEVSGERQPVLRCQEAERSLDHVPEVDRERPEIRYRLVQAGPGESGPEPGGERGSRAAARGGITETGDAGLRRR